MGVYDTGLEVQLKALESHESTDLNYIDDPSDTPFTPREEGFQPGQPDICTFTCTCTNQRNACAGTCTLSGILSSSSSSSFLQATDTATGTAQYAPYRSGGSDDFKLFNLGRDQRTLIELAELGLLHFFDNNMNIDTVESLIDDTENGTTASGIDFMKAESEIESVRIFPNSRNIVKQKGWSTVTELFHTNRRDDEICSSIRCMVSVEIECSRLLSNFVSYISWNS